MPEGPEVKTIARTLAEKLVGKKLGVLWHSEFRLRHDVDYRKIKEFEHHVVDDISCYGKLLFVDVNRKPALLAQLGMTGQLSVVKAKQTVLPHTHIRWPLINTDEELRYVDPRRFGLFSACDARERRAHIERLGPDPFSMTHDDKLKIISRVRKSNRAIKEILLDQTVVVGVGNIYASEALFLAKIDPRRRGIDISVNAVEKIIDAVIEVLHLADRNCGTTFSNYVDGTGNVGKNIFYLKVFQRNDEPCQVCETMIERIKQSGRSTFFCKKCQK